MPVFFDTSLLLKLYVPEPNTPAVVTLVASLNEPIWLTTFHLAEFANALMCKQGRGEISADDVQNALASLNADNASGVMVGTTPDWERIFYVTLTLSAAHAPSTLCRTLDALHVALALELKASALATTDKRQMAIAQAAGLKVLTP